MFCQNKEIINNKLFNFQFDRLGIDKVVPVGTVIYIFVTDRAAFVRFMFPLLPPV